VGRGFGTNGKANGVAEGNSEHMQGETKRAHGRRERKAKSLTARAAAIAAGSGKPSKTKSAEAVEKWELALVLGAST